MPTNFQWNYDRPFTMIQSVAANQNMGGVDPTGTPRSIMNGALYPESATGTAGIFRFHPKWDLTIIRVTLDMPGTQTSHSVFIGEDGVETLWVTGGVGVTDVIIVDRMPLRADGYVRVVTTGAPNAVITARVTVVRADHVRIEG